MLTDKKIQQQQQPPQLEQQPQQQQYSPAQWKKKKNSIKEKQRRSSYYLSTWLFLKTLSFVFFVAFFSAYIQIKGLVGDDGILPLTSILESKAAENTNVEINSIWIYFTKGLGLSVNTLLHLICIGGLIFSALSIFTISHSVYLGFMWFFYYCIVDVGQIFYGYQWDQLLLETAFLAIFISPFGSKYDEKPSQPIRYLLKWLLFRLMFGSGISKLTPIWSSLQAMSYHYETQCIPNALSYYFHQLPHSYHQFETLATLVIEILVPPLFFAPRLLRIGACFLNILLQVMVIITGNYHFFNYLTIALCLMLLDDSFLLSNFIPKILRQKLLDLEADRNRIYQVKKPEFGLSSINSKNLLIPFVFILVGTSSIYSTTRYLQRQSVPVLIQRVNNALSYYHLTGTYGLFSHMTTERFEVIIEGSYDGDHWEEYEFYYKPGNLSRAPPFIFPGHKPRLDWQMWFAGLTKDARNQPWLIHMMAKLLEGSPEVLSLIEYSPFPIDNPPNFIRAHRYKYTFTKWRAGSDEWWKRENVGLYVRPFSLDSSAYKHFISQ